MILEEIAILNVEFVGIIFYIKFVFGFFYYSLVRDRIFNLKYVSFFSFKSVEKMNIGKL